MTAKHPPVTKEEEEAAWNRCSAWIMDKQDELLQVLASTEMSCGRVWSRVTYVSLEPIVSVIARHMYRRDEANLTQLQMSMLSCAIRDTDVVRRTTGPHLDDTLRHRQHRLPELQGHHCAIIHPGLPGFENASESSGKLISSPKPNQTGILAMSTEPFVVMPLKKLSWWRRLFGLRNPPIKSTYVKPVTYEESEEQDAFIKRNKTDLT